MKKLPENVIVEILLRLPVKSLLRFKCVSKLWLSLISDPHFAKFHFELASSLSHRVIYIAGSEVRSIDFHASLYDDSAVVKVNFPITAYRFPVQIMGSCRGFLLLDAYEYDLLIWNPSTGFYKRLSYSPISSEIVQFPFIYGLGYDATEDDYLVVLATYNPSAANLVTHFEFFSMKANSWKKVEGTHFPYINAVDDPRGGLLLNGAIHWFAFRHDVSVEVILAFDVIERKLMEVPLLEDFNSSLEFCHLGALGGCLTLCIRSEEAEIWVMKEYGVKSSWTKSIIVSLHEIPTNYFSPICFTKGGEIVGIDGKRGLAKYNAEGKLLEHRAYIDYRQRSGAAIYTGSLLSLPSVSGNVGEDGQQ